jgi:hypothetical protein
VLTLTELVQVIPLAWNEETRGNEKRSGTHPAAGQCTVSSLLIQRHCGGVIVRCEVGGSTYARVIHYFNELDHGVIVDVTRAQFSHVKPFRKFKKNPDVSLYIFDDTRDRVDLLESRCLEIIRK